MPLKRTPPSNKCSPGQVSKSIPHSGSTHHLGDTESENITHRVKRKDDVNLHMEEIRNLISTSNAISDAKFTALQSSMAEIIAQNTEIKESIAFTAKQYDDMIVKLNQFEVERKEDRSRIQQLEHKVDNLERMLFSTKIEVRNIPKKQGENKDDLCTIIEQVANVLQTSLQRQEIKDVFRVSNKDSKQTAIIVDLNSAIVKETILRKARQFNNKNKNNKLNTTHLKLEGPPIPVYLSERLTPRTQRIFHLARNFAKNNDYKYCWTSYGRVFLRKDDGKQQFLITDVVDLNNLEQTK